MMLALREEADAVARIAEEVELLVRIARAWELVCMRASAVQATDATPVCASFLASLSLQEKCPAALVGEQVDALNASYHQAPTMAVQSANDKTLSTRKELVRLFGKDVYMQLYEYATNNFRENVIPDVVQIRRHVGSLLPASANPVQIYKEMEIIVFRASLGQEQEELFGKTLK